MIVDDDTMTSQILAGYLNGLGFKTISVESGEAAIEQVENIRPDIILLDVLMPGIDGFETCQQLKSNPITQEIPVIFMTALLEMSDKVRAFEAGGADYITKPHLYAEVLTRVNTHLTIRTLQRQLREKKGRRGEGEMGRWAYASS